jgi:peroxiredoxin Q/BCP
MSKPIAALLLLGLISLCTTTLADDSSAKAPVAEFPIGDALPSFELVDDQGRNWKSDEHVGKLQVLYFYPGDFTPGCTAQAQKFRDSLKELTKLGVEVIGISGDLPATHKLFKATYGLEHTLLSDTEGHLAKQLGVPVGPGGKARLIGPDRQPILGADNKSTFVERPVTLARWTFVIDQDGRVVSQRKVLNPATDSAEVLEIVRMLQK